MTEQTMQVVFACLLFLLGACIGSFLNVVAYRLPRGLSVVRPASKCTNCEKEVTLIGLIPVIGYLLIGGKCVFCKSSVSWRYPAVEFFTGLCTALLFYKYLDVAAIQSLFGGNNYADVPMFGRFVYQAYLPFITALWLLYSAIPLTLIDLEYRLLPDAITLPGIAVSFLLGSANPHLGWQGSLLGIVVTGGSLILIAKIYEWTRKREGMGYGDVKYFALLGGVLGVPDAFLGFIIASILGSVVGIIFGLISRKGLNAAIPFGPFLALGGLVSFLWGNDIWMFLYPPP